MARRGLQRRNLLFLIFLAGFSGKCLSAPTTNEEMNGTFISQNDINSINKKLEEMDKKLDILIDGRFSNATAATTKKPEESGKKTFDEHTNQSSDPFSYNRCVNLISIERSPTAEGNRFTIRFTKNADELFFRYTDFDSAPEKVPDSVVQEPGGVWAVSFTCAITRETQTPPWFTIGDVIHVEREDLSFLKSRCDIFSMLST
ncbi:hypothetical protein PoB_000959100 [Plakobranchus ocellatus]|uniref:Uncharacterized protein n=1 Tax=Plakobranchus ocellatus TaxID=259542 RepID=A0AAV3YIM2_9GAST|nr:hypothetical protein PoB_000959100 [Plakobranchus ocellatus]